MKYFIYCRKSSEEKERQVQSIKSQKQELEALRSARTGIEVVDILEEEQSAMTPGRPVFNQMLDRIQRGEAEGIIAWAVDRLARNAVDGGRIIHLLDTGAIKDLLFATYTFENSPSGKFMLAILFGQSKYYSDALSENVRRGLKTKLESGWLPGKAPIGYLNDKTTLTIVPDPKRLPLIREMWELMLTGAYSPRRILEILTKRGLRTVSRKREGGQPLALSAVYKVLANPFYAGVIRWHNRLYPGKHEPIITMSEFESVQRLIERPMQPRAKTREFAFTGMIRCGECGLSVTAEEKTNRHGSRYTYYHCTKRRLDYRCQQRSLERSKVEDEVEEFLLRLRIAPELQNYALQMVEQAGADKKLLDDLERKALADATTKNEQARRNLTKLRIADQISTEEFEEERQQLDRDRFRLLERQKSAEPRDRFEPERLCILFSIRAAEWFRTGNNTQKRMILEIAGSNPLLRDQKLKIDAAKLFRKWENIDSIPSLRAVVEDVRTLAREDENANTTLRLLRQLGQEMGKRDQDADAA